MPLPKPPVRKATLLSPADYPTAAQRPTPILPPAGTLGQTAEVRALKAAPAAGASKASEPSPSRTPSPGLVAHLDARTSPAPSPLARTVPDEAKSKRGRPDRTAPAVEPIKAAKSGRTKQASSRPVATKLFVLDTNVLMHDPMSIFRFEEHDVFLPMITLEELDGHKKGMSEVSRNVRQVSRELDTLAADGLPDPTQGIPLAKTGHREASGRLFFQTTFMDTRLPEGLPQGKADNQILGVVQALRSRVTDREVVLVSKDINMRIKARALGLPAEDYFNDKTLEDGDLLYTGVLALPSDFWEHHGKTMESWQQGGSTYYRISGPLVPALLINEFLYLEAPGAAPLYARVTEITGKTAVLRTLREFTHQKNAVWGVTARNREQNFALNLLMDPDCDFITLTGTAGTGKTLMTLAAGLAQVLDDRRYTEIIVTRVTVPVGEDIGFLPGTEEEKMGPWMGALDDNLEVLSRSDGAAGEWGRAATNDLVRSKIKIKSLNFMRGRTFLNKFVIIDEAQNLTPKQMKTLITRAGPGTKIVCLGNLAQIDTPYLTEGSSGLTYAVDRFKGWPHSGHVTLARGERSRLADYASEVL
ncbi:MAG: PhoH family protein [Betaproteobacteria bacterium]|nr:PhoH family protein [Betaproteobacteria bacterium]NBT10358.1 PhoH family protein [Betaproteobacteria bacterium]